MRSPRKNTLSGNKIGVDDAARQVARPVPLEMIELGVDERAQPRRDLVRARREGRKERPPAFHRKRVAAPRREIGAGEMQARQRRAERGAMGGLGVMHGIAVEKGDDHGGTAGEATQRDAGAVSHRQRAGDAARGEMFHQVQEERQVGFRDPLLIKREDEAAGAGVEIVVRIFDALGDAFAGQQFPKVIGRQKSDQLLIVDQRVDGHERRPFTAGRPQAIARSSFGRGKDTFSSALEMVSTAMS